MSRKIVKTLLISIGVLCVVLLVWFGGPLVAIADYVPLQSVTARLVTLLLILLAGLAWWGVGVIRARLANRRMLAAIEAAGESGSGQAPSSGQGPAPVRDDAQLEEVRSRFRRAMDVLRESGRGQGISTRLFGGRRHIYQLPWYLFIGAPGSGKTTALMNAGLQFPLAEKLGDSPIRGIGGTRNCDWWFTDQAVLIDTAGRYTTQDSDAQADAREWGEFLALLRRFRPRQPINGVLATVSVADLLQSSPEQRERMAIALRQRVQELLEKLDIAIPVYLLVTKADLLPGFTEFFADADRERREQVWGTTYPHAAQPAALATEFDAGFAELLRRIDDLSLDRLQAETDTERRARIHGFAPQFASLHGPLASFVATAFPESRLARRPMVRGVYFTSGTQEGSPVDRVMGAIARRFGLQRRLVPALRPSGKAYFLNRLLNAVVFPEAPLAGTNLRRERLLGVARWAFGVVGVGLALFTLVGMALSYRANSRYVAEVESRVAEFRQLLEGRVAGRVDLPTMLQLYASLRALPVTAEVPDPAMAPLSHGFGLFQGPKLAEAGDQAYHRVLAQTLAPLLVNRVASALERGGTPEWQYETLKVYVMLSEPGRLDVSTVKGWIGFDLDANPIPGIGPEQQRALVAHADALLSRGVFRDSIVVDDALVSRVRASLTRAPFPQRVYERMKRQGVGDFPDFRITTAGGPTAASVFSRRSGASVNEGVPGFYTYDGYHKGFGKALGDVVRDLSGEEVWVLGVADSPNARLAKTGAGRESLEREVRRLYLQDYATVWERFVGDIAVARGDSLQASIQVARVLSAPDSPLPRLMRAIAREVTLGGDGGRSTVDRAVDKASEAVKDTRETLGKLLGRTPDAPTQRSDGGRIEDIVDGRFEALRTMVKAPEGGGAAPIDRSTALIAEIQQSMLAAESAVNAGTPPPASDVPNKVRAEAGRLAEPVRSMLSGLASGGSSQAIVATRGSLTQEMTAALGDFCARATAGRYPFDRASARDVPADDFARLFGPGGLFDDFFQKRLLSLVDTSSRPWRFRKLDNVSVADSPGLAEFQKAAEIRAAFFPANARGPAVRFEMRLADIDPGLAQVTLDVDGQVLQFAAGQRSAQAVQWPGPKGANQVSVSSGGPQADLVLEGPWAALRLFDAAQVESTGQPERFRATFRLSGRKVSFDVTSSSVRNPFRLAELQTFRCPNRL